MRSEEEINDQIVKAHTQRLESGGTKWRGMSYEQGVADALSWAIEDEETAPMD